MTLPMTGKNCSLALKWLISFAIPLIVYWAMPIDGQTVTHHMALFLSITTWAICIWAMDAMNEIAVGLILPVLYIVLCGVKQQVVYSPWLSEVPLIVIGGFALGKILQETGLGKRIGLTCVRCMGGSFTGTLIGITLAVSIVAPLVPAITGKAAIFCAIGISLCDALDFKAKGREASSSPAASPWRRPNCATSRAARTSCSAWACCKRLPASAAHGWNTPCITSFPVCCIPSCLWGWSC